MARQATVVADRAGLTAHAAAWDELAEACSRPFSAFEWLLGWWDHARPPRACLAVVLVHAGSQLVGVAPGFCDRGPARIVRWRPLGAQACQHVEPFALPGSEAEVAAVVAPALHGLRPQPQALSFEGIEERSPWPGLLAAAWPGAGTPRTVRLGAATALVLDIEDPDFDTWLAGKTQHFRKRLKRSRKLARDSGGAFRLADAESAPADVEAFLRLHVDRWQERGGSRAVPPPVAAFLRAAGPRLVASGHLRVWSLDVGGQTVASSLVLRAGSQLGYWLSGFDTAHAKLEPSKLAMLHVIEDAFALGATRLDLGEGALAYKQRFSDTEERLLRLVVVPPSPRAMQVAAGLAPARARAWAARNLSAEQKARLRRLLRRGRGS